MAAGLATIERLSSCDYAGLEARTTAFAGELAAILRAKGLPVQLQLIASMFTLYFTEAEVTDLASAKTSDANVFGGLYRHMREQGVNLAPSGFEAAFTSFAHTDADLEATLQAARKFKP
jgi:glutamate-1-semialdehyde 2,1-aminomutase